MGGALKQWDRNQSESLRKLRLLKPAHRKRFIKALSFEDAERLMPIKGPEAWAFWARPKQFWAPSRDKIAFYSAGRGWGKTLTGSCALNLVAECHPKHYGNAALVVGRTAADVRDVMVMGPSGIMATANPRFLPKYEPSKMVITWPNGFSAILRSADKPEALRGHNVGITWCDEWAHWSSLEEAWANVQLCCRIGESPHHIITSTPLSLQIVKDLIAGDFGRTKVTYGHTMENVSGLAPGVVADLMRMWEGTTLGLQELGGQILDQNEHALWDQTMFTGIRADDPREEYFELALAVDPAGGGHRKPGAGKKRGSDETGIILLGTDEEQNIDLIDDLSKACPAREWAQRIVHTVNERDVDTIYVEINYGGDMVRTVLEQTEGWAECGARIIEITARRSKGDRARIVVGHYEKRKVRHIGPAEKWRKLEGQMTTYDPSMPRGKQDSPDRMDAAVWGVLGLIRDGEAMAHADPHGAESDSFWGSVQDKVDGYDEAV